jgi:hypothetical protein
VDYLSNKGLFSSRISGFYKKTVDERISIVADRVGLTDEELEILRSMGGIGSEDADRMT